MNFLLKNYKQLLLVGVVIVINHFFGHLGFLPFVFLGTWSAGGNSSTARKNLGGAGSQTAGLSFGGYNGSALTTVEEYDGTSWSAGTALGTAVSAHGGAGTQTAALSFGGYTTANTTATNEYDGTSWTAGGALTEAKRNIRGCGTQTAGLTAGGHTSTQVTTTEEYDGTSWTTGGALGTATYDLVLSGTQTAGLGATGYDGTNQLATSEKYDGTSWTSGNSLTGARNSAAASLNGSQTATIVFGGNNGGALATTEIYDGTNWSSDGNLTTARLGHAGAGDTSAGLAFNGSDGTNYLSSTEEYTGEGTTYYQTLSATEVSSTTLSGISTFSKLLATTEISTLTLSTLKSFYRTMSVTETSIVSLFKGLFQSLSTTATSVNTLTKAKIYYKTLSAIENSILSLTKLPGKVLSAIENSTATLTSKLSIYRTLSATENSIATLIRTATHCIELFPSWGGALSFDGTDDYVDTADISAIELTDATFEFWVKVDDLTKDNDIITKGTHSTNQPLLVWFDKSVGAGDLGVGNTNTISVITYDGSTEHWIAAPTNTINDNNWHHIVVIVNPTVNQLKIYVDGNLVASHTKTWNGIQDTTTLIRLGDSTPSGTHPFNGTIDEVRIYNRALSAEETGEHYRGLFKNETGLVGHWDMDEGSGDVVADSSGQGNDGTRYGATWEKQGAPRGVVSSVNLIKGMSKSLSVIETSIVSLAKLPKKILSATMVSVSTLTRKLEYYRTLSVVETSTATLLKSFSKSLSAVATSISTITTIASRFITMSVTEISTATITLLKTFYRTLSATEISVASLNKIWAKVLLVTETSVVSLEAAHKFITLAATEISVSTISLAKTFYRTLSTSVISIVSLLFPTHWNRTPKNSTNYTKTGKNSISYSKTGKNSINYTKTPKNP